MFCLFCLLLQVLTLLQYLSSYCKLLQACVVISKELIGQADFLKPLLTNVFAVLTLDNKDLGERDSGGGTYLSYQTGCLDSVQQHVHTLYLILY